MALNATLFNFEIALSDSDRGVYESLELRVAQHPSESPQYLATRLLAYCLECTEGLAFTKGLSDAEVPALSVHDLRGELISWIEVGLPEPPRLHKAAKASPRVPRLVAASIHRAREIEIYAIDLELLASLAAQLTRRMKFDLVVTDRHLYLSLGAETLSGSIERYRIEEGLSP
jgi:uncharacterized protein YaeQ